MRSILGNIRMIVLPGQLAVGSAHEAFNEDGSMKDEKQAARAREIGAAVASAAEMLKS